MKHSQRLTDYNFELMIWRCVWKVVKKFGKHSKRITSPLELKIKDILTPTVASYGWYRIEWIQYLLLVPLWTFPLDQMWREHWVWLSIFVKWKRFLLSQNDICIKHNVPVYIRQISVRSGRERENPVNVKFFYFI